MSNMLLKIRNMLSLKSKAKYQDLVKQGAVIVDVRSKREFEAGHIDGSLNITINSLNSYLPKLKELNKPIIMCCATGTRSSFAKSILKSKGFDEVYNGGNWYSLERKIKSA